MINNRYCIEVTLMHHNVTEFIEALFIKDKLPIFNPICVERTSLYMYMLSLTYVYPNFSQYSKGYHQ